ncbi:MAG: small subunit ribosomal protein [Miltoncostaeaceae bacterium]|jgi:small subunit ribosomal protein S6|nr:small subunit ribosomal protein [Miltoncostaeaceae bacterium]
MPSAALEGAAISPYELMVILNPDVAPERQEDLLNRVRQVITDSGGQLDHLDDWGRRKIAYPMNKQPEGRYVVMTCSTTPTALDEISRVLAINKDIVLRSMPVRLNPAQAERARAHGAPAPPPVDERTEEPRRGGGGRGRRRPR